MNRAQEAALTYSNFEVIPVSIWQCPKSIVYYFFQDLSTRLTPNITRIISISQNHLDKLWFTFYKEVIRQLFFSEIYQKTIHIQFQI